MTDLNPNNQEIRVLIWNEHRHEKKNPDIGAIYPDGIHGAIATGLELRGLTPETATLDDPHQGIPPGKLAEIDVLIWWGHMAHPEVSDELVDRVQARVLEGMGLIVLHSGHFSKVFKRLMGTTCDLKWREIGERERIWVVENGHPIAEGLVNPIVIPEAEMYGERFDIPAPDTLVFLSWFQGGEVFRSGCCYRRGKGKIFYFRPGHETYPIYYRDDIQKVIYNAVRWAAPTPGPVMEFGNIPEPPEPVL